MKKMEWVDVDKVGGKAHWGDRERVTVGTKRDKEIKLKDGSTAVIEETIISITRFPNGAHAIETNAPNPEPVEE